MPGYPLVLVSTDVFQEGEDLHAFCDSVVHYGLSGSPVSLEQKTGRVDRVSSKAQRRLIALEQQAEDDDFIQVTFPYVKESIEALQIKLISKNLNDFINSLHDFTATGRSDKETTYLRELLNKEDVPDQILTRLYSPYNPAVDEKNEYHEVQLIEENSLHREAEVNHICKLVKSVLANKVENGVNAYFQDDGSEVQGSKLAIQVNSAKASGELLLSLTRRAEPFTQQILTRKTLMKLMHEISWCTFHRMFAIKCSEMTGYYQLFFNAEMLVGGLETTQHTEIERIFERMEIEHNPDNYSRQLSGEIEGYVDSIHLETPIPIDRSKETKLQIIKEDGLTILLFEFGSSQVHRTQRVEIYECDGRCIFISRATRPGYSKKLSVNDIIKYTWIRNRYVDLVEFVVDPLLSIVGRVVHPVQDMQWNEFIYCAYTLAVEADDLEYLLSQIDIH